MNDDGCDDCYRLETSGTVQGSKKNGILMSTWHVTESKFIESFPEINNLINTASFWVEYASIVPIHKRQIYHDTLLVWNNIPSDIELDWHHTEKTDAHPLIINGFNRVGNDVPDTITLDIYRPEPVVQGKFIYIKKGVANSF